MAEFVCKLCGKTFDRVGNGVYCPGPHYRPCPVCGKDVQYFRPSESVKCCSVECTRRLAQLSKRRNLGQRACAECGKLFVPAQATQIYCSGPHESSCVVCGQSFTYTCRPSERPQTCSRACQTKLQSITYFQQTGYNNPSENPEVREKISVANSSADVAAKRAATSMQHWGTANPAKSAVIRQKISDVQRDAEFQLHRYDAYKVRTGFDIPMQNPEVVRKQQQTNLERYGTTGHPRTREGIAKVLTDPTKIDNYLEFKSDPESYIHKHYSENPNISQLEQDLGCTNTPIYDILISAGCRDLLATSYSTLEDEVVQFLISICPNIQVVRNNRTVIKPEEIDIYLPEYHVGIECNPVCTHNSSFVDPWGQAPKPYKYHQDKSVRAQSAGVFLFHVFGYEWSNRQSVVKSMLRNLLGLTETKFNGRDTEVVDLTVDECRRFLNENHRQGNAVASVRLGLRLRSTQELVSVMTFGHPRNSLGKSNGQCEWELSRFCSKQNTLVHGAASKLLNAFEQRYHPTSVVSFSDFAHTRGQMYNTLGFTFDNLTSPSYVWVDLKDQVYYTRVSCQKHRLPKLLNESDLDIEAQTEREIMESHKFARVFDSGVMRWVKQYV